MMSVGTFICYLASVLIAMPVLLLCGYWTGQYDERKKWNIFLLSCREPDNRIYLVYDPKHEDGAYRRG